MVKKYERLVVVNNTVPRNENRRKENQSCFAAKYFDDDKNNLYSSIDLPKDLHTFSKQFTSKTTSPYQV